MSTLTQTPAEIVARGWQVYYRAMESEWAGRQVGEVVTDLHDALDTFGAIHGDRIHPASAFQELAGHPEAKHEALKLAAQDVDDWVAELTRVLPACAVTTEAEVAA